VAVVREEDGTLWLDFDDGAVQSRMLRADPARLVLEYTRRMMGFLLLHPAPERIAMIGLGGGSLAKYCAATLPEVDFTAVEIAPDVIALREAFGIPPDGPRFRIFCEDGAEFVRRDGPAVDVLIVDAFDRTGQPESLCSAAFYDYCHDRLAPGGRGPGAGLGLSIVRSVVAAHGGRVTARPRTGGGLVVEVFLPQR